MKRIVHRETTRVSPWVQLIAKSVSDGTGEAPAVYHCLGQRDYVSVLAKTEDGFFPIVRQFRPAVEKETWELPAGLLEEGESPETCAQRELLEEVGLETRSLTFLGAFHADTGRLQNACHCFFARTSPKIDRTEIEDGIGVSYVTYPELLEMTRQGQFAHLIHLGTLFAAQAQGISL